MITLKILSISYGILMDNLILCSLYNDVMSVGNNIQVICIALVFLNIEFKFCIEIKTLNLYIGFVLYVDLVFVLNTSISLH